MASAATSRRAQRGRETAFRRGDRREQEILDSFEGAWDLHGARAAGLRTAFIERPLEKGPEGRADRAADAPADIAVGGFDELAQVLG